MKKFLTSLTLALVIAATFQANAQYCGSSQISSCGLPVSNYGFGPLDSMPCLTRGGTNNNITLKFKVYTNFTAQNQTVSIKKMRIDSITNLPCGVCWSTNSATNEFLSNATGCLKFQGLTLDAAGQYKLGLIISVATLDTITYDHTVNADLGGIYLYARVADPGNNCMSVDTNGVSAGHGSSLTASCAFHLGIQETVNALRDLSVQPNPMNSEAKINFTSEQGGDVRVKISTIVGSVVYDNIMQAKPGINETTISKGNLSDGVYILSVGNNKGTTSRKFVITD